jgi:hypothetical protein
MFTFKYRAMLGGEFLPAYMAMIFAVFYTTIVYLNEKLQYTTQTFSHPSLSTNNLTTSSHVFSLGKGLICKTIC